MNMKNLSNPHEHLRFITESPAKYCEGRHETVREVDHTGKSCICNSYTMGCPPVRGDNPRALASGLSYVQVDKHGITILYHQHQCRHCTSRDISCSRW